jgi:LPXTG-site transpeptidase (sortase) family protein
MSGPRSREWLVWIERGLWAVGILLVAWCGSVLIAQWRTRNMPIPPPAAAAAPSAGTAGTTGVLPGEESRPAPPPAAIKTGAWVARLTAPTIALTATVLEGTDDRTLARAAGHIEDTALPGENGNVGIAGHRDTIFRPVRLIKVGDPIVITTADHVYRYRVTKTSIVGPQDVYVLDPAGHPTLTLVTCYPFTFIGHAPKRFIVSADLVAR